MIANHRSPRRDGAPAQRLAATSTRMNAASSIDNTPRHRMPGVGQALSNVSDAFRRKIATETDKIRLKADPTFGALSDCTRSIIAYPPSRVARATARQARQAAWRQRRRVSTKKE